MPNELKRYSFDLSLGLGAVLCLMIYCSRSKHQNLHMKGDAVGRGKMEKEYSLPSRRGTHISTIHKW